MEKFFKCECTYLDSDRRIWIHIGQREKICRTHEEIAVEIGYAET